MVKAVIFDWGGTLTPWHAIDFDAEARALAAAVTSTGDSSEHANALKLAVGEVWGRSRDHQQSARVDDLFEAAGLTHDRDALGDYYAFWEPHTVTDPQVAPMWLELADRGIRIGVLSNTLWSRELHRGWFARDGVLEFIDGDVYSSEVAWTKPSPMAFEAAMHAVGLSDPTECVYVGDRLFDDVWGAHNAGMRARHIPHSDIPAAQVGHSEGDPDAVAHELAEIPELIRGW